ncbi:unnamed protein product [Somion occarium]|uniref:protein-tyrosine-phosphatase n=1 Tax=Somion occarium TaxID=3059160 RepID=A0ABP1E217_9APHY
MHMAKGKKPHPRKTETTMKESASLILDPYLYLGPCSAASSSFVSSVGITHILSIGSTPTTHFPNVVYERIPLIDSPTSSLLHAANRAAIFLDSVEAAGGKVLVHCSAAISRSPAVVAAYLVIRKRMSLKQALGRILQTRPSTSPNRGFMVQLNEIELEHLGALSLGLDELPRRKEERLALFVDVAENNGGTALALC